MPHGPETERVGQWSRRTLLLASAAGALSLSAAKPAGAVEGSIEQPKAATPEAFIDRAFALRDLARDQGDQPYGAVVVKHGRIVGQAPSRVVTNGDPTAHAEIEALRDAARRLGTRDLGECLLYSSSRPCPMCEAAAYWAGIARLVHGRGRSDAGRPQLSRC